MSADALAEMSPRLMTPGIAVFLNAKRKGPFRVTG